jgi:hypothetical protein
MKLTKMISADGGTEIEVPADKVKHFENKGYRQADKPVRGRSPKAELADANEEK